MRKLIRDKYQTVLPGRIEAGQEWVDPPLAHTGEPYSNCMPPDPNLPTQGASFGGVRVAGDSDVSNHTGRPKKGYTRIALDPAAEEWTGQHADQFYGEAYGPDGKGFVERNNVLDRE